MSTPPPSTDDGDELFLRHLESALDAISDAPLDLDPAPWHALIREAPESIRADLLVELVKADMARRAASGQQPMIEHYHAILRPYFEPDAIPLSLVMEERQLRQEEGHTIDPGEYERRFPQWQHHVQQFGDDATEMTGSVGPVRPSMPASATIDDFELLQPLGSGAFAEVHLARQISMRRLVALKISQAGIDESQTLARLDHPNIVRVFDQRSVAASGVHLIYMQFLPGGTLADVVAVARQTPPEERSGKLLLDSVDQCLLATAQQVPERSSVRDWLSEASWPAVVAWIGIQLGGALHAAHRRGVLHRDVKPANVLLSSEGIPKLADFNVSLAGTSPHDDETIGSSIGGSIGYMSPEHLRAVMHRDADPNLVGERADLYSTAVLLWELWQGRRPFMSDDAPQSRQAFLASQLQSRDQPFVEPDRTGLAAERSLEKALRQILHPDPNQRVQDGNELSARLRLSLHPEAAEIFDPDPDDWRERIGRWSPWLIAPVIILLPNIAAGVFNFAYNEREIIEGHDGMAAGFYRLASVVNAIAFPLGAIAIVVFAWPVAAALQRTADGTRVSADAITKTLSLSRRAAWIGGALWLVAAVVYPATLSWWYPQFTFADAVHFFGSLLICGGVAMAYPFFGLALLSTWVYYPRLVRRTMSDGQFDQRGEQLRRVSGRFLLTAAGVPLLGLALLLSRPSMTKDIVAASVGATALGLIAAWWAYQCIWTHWQQMGDVLSRTRGRSIPGADTSLIWSDPAER